MRLNQYLAAALLKGTQRKFSRLHADFLEITMSTPTDNNINEQNGQARPAVGRPANVEALGVKPLPGSTGVDNTTSGMSVGSQVTVGPIKPVDRKTIIGSTPGDFRSQAAPAVLPNNAGPRESMGQFPLSGKQASAPAPESFPGNLADSDAGN